MNLNQGPSTFRWGDPSEDEERARGQIAYAEEKTKELKEQKPTDKYLRIGVVIGLIAGLVVGVRTAYGNLFWIIGCIIAGGIAGVLLGSLAGALIARCRKHENHTSY
jgi:hypothetical protein